MHVEVDVIIFGKRVKIGEIHIEQVLRLEGAEGSHGGGGEEDGLPGFLVRKKKSILKHYVFNTTNLRQDYPYFHSIIRNILPASRVYSLYVFYSTLFISFEVSL